MKRIKLRYRCDWYARNGCIRQVWFQTLKEAQAEATKHKEATVWKETPGRARPQPPAVKE